MTTAVPSTQSLRAQRRNPIGSGITIQRKGVFYIMRLSHTYMMTNQHHNVIYVGVTSNLIKRVHQHKTKFYKGFTSRYNCNILVFFQEFTNISEAIAYEKKLKAGNRARKEKLINEQNPEWKDLSEGWIFDV